MKINDHLYSYPILCAKKNDYQTCKFVVEAETSKTLNSINMVFNITMDCEEIQELINSGLAEYVIHIECPTTAYRQIWSLPLPKINLDIPYSKVNGSIERTAFIVTKENIENFTCSDWNEDFASIKFSLKKGTMLAYQNFPKLIIKKNYEEFFNKDSIFIVYKILLEDKPMVVELMPNYIKIGLSKKEYEIYEVNNKNPKMQPILNSMIIFPALIYVFEYLKKSYSEEYENFIWINSLIKFFGSNWEDYLENMPSIELAHMIMDSPLSKAFSGISSLIDAYEEE